VNLFATIRSPLLYVVWWLFGWSCCDAQLLWPYVWPLPKLSTPLKQYGHCFTKLALYPSLNKLFHPVQNSGNWISTIYDFSWKDANLILVMIYKHHFTFLDSMGFWLFPPDACSDELMYNGQGTTVRIATLQREKSVKLSFVMGFSERTVD
jgi:hypothetical protein